MTDDLIIFVHVPRTAGTSLWYAFMEALPDVLNRGRRWPQVLIAKLGHRMKEPDAPTGFGLSGNELEVYIDEIRSNPFLKIVGGHLAYGLHSRIDTTDPIPYKYATLLRDPVDRVVSLYSMLRSRPLTFHNEQAIGDPITHMWAERYELNLSAMLRDGESRVCNDQTRMITGGSEDPREAIDLLQREFIYGLSEETTTFSEQISEMLGVNIEIGTYNILEREVNPKKKRIERYIPDFSEMALIKEANWADIEVYEWAKRHMPVAV